MINTITLNPAIDHILYLESFERNFTNRVTDTAIAMGGKGTHVSLNLAGMGAPSRAYGFGFGVNGQRIVKMLTEHGVQPRFVCDMDFGESRDNYLIVERKTRDATLVATKGPAPTADHVNALYRMLKEDAAPGQLYALSGDASNFTDPFVYNSIMETLVPAGAKIFLDASGDTLLHAVELNPFLIKPNQAEMSLLAGKKLVTPPEIRQAIRDLERRYQIYAIVVSLGGDGSLARIGDRLYRVRPPVVDVYNTVGCGDCMLAGMLYGFEHGYGAEETLRFATACSAATAESPLSVGFDLERARSLLNQVDIRTE